MWSWVTKGFANKYPLEGYALDGKSLSDDVKPNHEKLNAHSFVPEDVKKALMEKYKHPIVKNIEDKDGSFYITIQYDEKDDFTTVPQGSITVNGISLTVADSGFGQFSVAIIPYTWEFTNMKNLKIGNKVNLEFDIIGKYVTKLMKKNAIL